MKIKSYVEKRIGKESGKSYYCLVVLVDDVEFTIVMLPKEVQALYKLIDKKVEK